MSSTPEPREEPERRDRREIRAAVVERLRGLHLDFGQRVYQNRIRPLWPKGLPTVVIYTLREEVEVANVAPRQYERTLELVVELCAKLPAPADGSLDVVQTGDGLDDLLDGLAREVEERLERDQTLGGLVQDLQHKRFEFEPVDNGEERFAFARLFESITYYTPAPERPEAGFDPLRSVESSLQVGGPDGLEVRDRTVLNPT